MQLDLISIICYHTEMDKNLKISGLLINISNLALYVNRPLTSPTLVSLTEPMSFILATFYFSILGSIYLHSNLPKM